MIQRSLIFISIYSILFCNIATQLPISSYYDIIYNI